MPTAESTKERTPIYGKRRSVRQKNTALQKKHPMYGRDKYFREEEQLQLQKCNTLVKETAIIGKYMERDCIIEGVNTVSFHLLENLS